jgi:hypothetical protein
MAPRSAAFEAKVGAQASVGFPTATGSTKSGGFSPWIRGELSRVYGSETVVPSPDAEMLNVPAAVFGRYCGALASCGLSCFVGRWFNEPAGAGGLTLLSAFAM